VSAAAPASLKRRGYAGPDDHGRMQELQRAGWRAFGPRVPSHPGDLEWGRAGGVDPGTDWSDAIVLWEDNATGDVRAWAIDHTTVLDLYLHPDERPALTAHGLMAEALAWFLDEDRLLRAHGEVPQRLGAWADAGDPLEDLLERRGFTPDPDRGLVHRAMRLDGRLADPEQVDGYVLFGLSLQGDLARRVEVHRAAFDPSRMTSERYGSVMAMPLYRPELDIVAVGPDGEFAAFCLAWYDPLIRVGLFEPVGTHPAHRRRGLAAAVCREALRRLAAVGAEWALVSAVAGEPTPNHLYASLGFVEVMRSSLWRRGGVA